MTPLNHIIRVLIVDDHTIVRRGIKALLAETEDIEVIGEADNGLEAIRMSKMLEPDVILMDLLMPRLDGIEATRQITAQQPNMRVLVLTSFVVDEEIFPAIKAGALGYLLKDSEPGELIRSIHKVYRGEPSLNPSIACKIMKEVLETPAGKPTPDPLTARRCWSSAAPTPAARRLKTGGLLSLTFNNRKEDTNNVFSTFNPLYNSALTFNLTQPLLRNFKVDASRQQLRVSKKNKEISDVSFTQTVLNTVANVKQRYNELIYAIDNLDAARKSLSLARKLLEENQIRVKVGTMAPLDVIEAESEVAARDVSVITAEAAVVDAEDNLKRTIFPKTDSAMWALGICFFVFPPGSRCCCR